MNKKTENRRKLEYFFQIYFFLFSHICFTSISIFSSYLTLILLMLTRLDENNNVNTCICHPSLTLLTRRLFASIFTSNSVSFVNWYLSDHHTMLATKMMSQMTSCKIIGLKIVWITRRENGQTTTKNNIDIYNVQNIVSFFRSCFCCSRK